MNQWPHDLPGNELDQLLLDYLDGYLDENSHLRLQQHMVSCKDCSARLEENQAFAGFRDLLLIPSQTTEPPPDLASRLKLRIQQETFDLKKQKRVAFPFWLAGYRKYARMTAAAVLVLVLSTGGLLSYRFMQQSGLLGQPATPMANQPAVMMAKQADTSAADTTGAGEQARIAKNQIALDSAKGVENVTEETTAGAMLYSKAAPQSPWRDAKSENISLPLVSKKSPDQPVLTNELLSGAQAVVWIEPDLLLAAYDEALLDAQLERLEKTSSNFEPDITIKQKSEKDLREFLSNRLGTAIAGEIAGTLVIKDCGYLILTIGGT